MHTPVCVVYYGQLLKGESAYEAVEGVSLPDENVIINH
jgi:hypothetical protein